MSSHTIEDAYNFRLADLLRLQGLRAEAEQSRTFGSNPGRADVLVDFDDKVVVIDAEFGRPAIADAEKRLPLEGPAIVNGLPVTMAVAIGYPLSLKSLPERDSFKNLDSCKDLLVAYRHYGRAWEDTSICSVAQLASTLHNYWVQNERNRSIDDTVQGISRAISQAAEVLDRVGKYGVKGSDESATKALVWFNALLYQELLARHLSDGQLSDEYRVRRISRPRLDAHPSDLIEQWGGILEMNWWSIFHVARESLHDTDAFAARLAIKQLIKQATRVAESGVIRQHDIAGRILHRLLKSRRFLATNYTTIPAAIMLAGLALERREWSRIDFGNLEDLSCLTVVDPACGSGTLLMAALHELARMSRRAAAAVDRKDLMKCILENVLYGFDVVPAAIHMAAASLCMAEPGQVISEMKLWRLQHDVIDGHPRMGSLDFLAKSPAQGKATVADLFDTRIEHVAGVRVTGAGEQVEENVLMPSKCDLVIANPPYTRAGGPGDDENSRWNPIFGSLLNKADTSTLQTTLRQTISGTPANLTAGLGSAFLVLADEHLAKGGRMAFVLPATLLTGERWKNAREMLISKYRIDWVIVSHDPRTRGKKKGLPGRYWTSFSESTELAETLVVATKTLGTPLSHCVRFVNLLKNPDEAIDAFGMVERLLAMEAHVKSYESRTIRIGQHATWGTLIRVPQRALTNGAWRESAFVQYELTRTGCDLVGGTATELLGPTAKITELSNVAELGPYHLNVRGKNQGLFESFASFHPVATEIPALWHHKADEVVSLMTRANATLERKPLENSEAQVAMLARKARLQMALELRTTSQRMGAVLTDVPMLGIRSWLTIKLRTPKSGKEEALCLWLNSTFGILIRILHGNRSYLGRTALTNSTVKTLPVLDVDRLTPKQLTKATQAFDVLKERTFMPVWRLASDPARRELDDRMCALLGGNRATLKRLAGRLAQEPILCGNLKETSSSYGVGTDNLKQSLFSGES